MTDTASDTSWALGSFSWLPPVHPASWCTGKASTRHSHPPVSSLGLVRRQNSPPLERLAAILLVQPTGLPGCLYCKGSSVAYSQLALNKGPQPFCKAAFQPVRPPACMGGYSSPRVQFAQPLNGLQRTLDPFLQPQWAEDCFSAFTLSQNNGIQYVSIPTDHTATYISTFFFFFFKTDVPIFES